MMIMIINFVISPEGVRKPLSANFDVNAQGGGVLHNFQYGEVHANIWGPKFYVKSIFGVCELQHGQKFNILGP